MVISAERQPLIRPCVELQVAVRARVRVRVALACGWPWRWLWRCWWIGLLAATKSQSPRITTANGCFQIRMKLKLFPGISSSHSEDRLGPEKPLQVHTTINFWDHWHFLGDGVVHGRYPKAKVCNAKLSLFWWRLRIIPTHAMGLVERNHFFGFLLPVSSNIKWKPSTTSSCSPTNELAKSTQSAMSKIQPLVAAFFELGFTYTSWKSNSTKHRFSGPRG